MSDAPGGRAAQASLAGRIGLGLVVLLACFALMRAWQVGQSVAGIDYYQFWVVGEAIEHDGVKNPYADEARAQMGRIYLERAMRDAQAVRQQTAAGGREVLETYSTPFLYTAMHALASGDYETDFTRWHVLSLVAFAGGVLLFAQAASLGWGGGLGILALVVLFGAPFQSEIQVANVNRLQLGALAVAPALLARARSGAWMAAAGLMLALSTLFKPNVAFASALCAVAVVSRDERPAWVAFFAGAGMGTAIGVATGALYFGSFAAWFDWAATLAVIPDEIIHVSLGNYAPLPALVGSASGALSLGLACALTIAPALALGRSTPKRDALDRGLLLTTSLGLGGAVALVTATLVWEHYFLLALPLFVALAAVAVRVRAEGPSDWLRFRVLPALSFLALLATPTFGIAGLSHETYFPLVQGSALVVAYGLGVALLFAPPRFEGEEAEEA